MDLPAETRSAIVSALAIEEAIYPDWNLVGQICDGEISRINETGLGDKINGLPYQFLEDYDIRRKDQQYGESQCRKIKDYLAITQ